MEEKTKREQIEDCLINSPEMSTKDIMIEVGCTRSYVGDVKTLYGGI